MVKVMFSSVFFCSSVSSKLSGLITFQPPNFVTLGFLFSPLTVTFSPAKAVVSFPSVSPTTCAVPFFTVMP